MGSKSTGDDVGLRSPFLPTELKERKRKTPLVKQEKVEVGSHKMQIERLSSFCWTKWREQLSEGFFFRLLPYYLYSIKKYWVFNQKFGVFFTTVYRISAIDKSLSPF
jgi:hypothetical protein